MKIVVDAFGGDFSPEEIVKGAIEAQAKENVTITLVGKQDKIKELLSSFSCNNTEKIEIIDASEVISNEEAPTEAVMNKKDSSLVKAFDVLTSDNEAAALVSAGSTGAVLTAAVLLTKRIRGINRPALAPLLPTLKGDGVLLIDCGANIDCKPQNLYQFALMGEAFMREVVKVNEPKIGLLSNGTEDKKGNELNKETFPLLKNLKNFKGNMEAREILSGDYDVVVSDGFAGNVALKSAEGTALTVFKLIKNEIKAGGLRAKIGAFLLLPYLKNIKKKMDYGENGGAVLLGLQKVVVKAHGSSKAESICAAILQAKHIAEAGVVSKIEEALHT